MAKKKDLKEVKRKKFFKENAVLLSIAGGILLLGIVVMLFSSANSQDDAVNSIYGDDEIQMHYFHLATCPNCQRQDAYLPQLEEQYPNLNVIIYDVTQPQTGEIYEEFAEQFEGLNPEQFPGTPLTIVGDEFNVGFGTADSTGPILESMVEKKQNEIDANWDDETMQTTIDARREYLENNEE